MRHPTRALILLPVLVSACPGAIDPNARGGSGPSQVEGTSPPLGPSDQMAPDHGQRYRTPDIRLPPLPPPGTPVPTPARPFPGANQPAFGEVARGSPAALPIIGGTLLVARDGRTAIAADPDRDRIFVVDLAQGTLTRQLVLEPGSEPGRLAEDPGGRVFVALRAGGQLITLAPGTFELVDRRPVCPAPRGLAVLPDGSRVYVACAGGELVALPAAGGPPLWTRVLERDLRDVVLDADGASLMVSTFRSARLLVTDLAGNPRGELAPPISLNLTRRSRSGPEGPAATRFTPSVAWRTLAAPSGGALMLHQRGFTGEIAAGSNAMESSGGYTGGNCGGGPVQSVVSLVGPSAPARPGPEIGGAVLAVDAALSSDGRLMALVAAGDAYVPTLGSLIVFAPLERLTSGDDTGCVFGTGDLFAPIVPPGQPAPPPPDPVLPRNRLSGEAVAVAFDGSNQVVVQFRQPPAVYVPQRGLIVPLTEDSRGHIGQAIFHANTGGGIACASCHPEGGEDGRVWRFSSGGRRRTQSLRGGISPTVPFHWDGDMRDIAHIAQEIFTVRMGGPPLDAYSTAALAQWIDSIPMLPRVATVNPDAVARGQAVFQSAQTGCSSCHSGPRLTNNQTVDVGTGQPFQVPSLLGLGARAPYLHDGCAPTAAARFSPRCGGGDRHGVTSTLNQQQTADLQAYLESL